MSEGEDEEAVGALVARAQALEAPLGRRQAAFEALVRRYQDLAYGYAYALLHEPHLAQDATQEAFLAAYRNLAQLREPEAFAGWLRRIVRTYCVRLRRTKEPPLVALDRAAAVRSEPGDPAGIAEAHERQAFVASVLEALPARERTATVLFYLGGYPQHEIAAFLGVTVMTVKKRLQASRKRMQGKVAEMMRDTLREQAPSKDERLVDAVRFLAELEASAGEGDVHLVELLLVDGVDVDAQDGSGRTLLSCAAQRGNLDAVELLLRHGAEVNAKDRTGKTPLRWASEAKHAATAALLRKCGGTL